MIRLAAVAHLGLVSLGALHIIHFDRLRSFGNILGCYQAYSGADNAYGFFAPSVASEWRAVFDLYDKKTNRWTRKEWKSSNPEIKLLLSTINGHFSLEGVRESLAASWAGTVFGENPEATIVIVKAEAFLIPTMHDFRDGKRPKWQTLLAYPFTIADRTSFHEPSERDRNQVALRY